MNLISVEFPMPSFEPKCPKNFAGRVVTAARKQGLLIPSPCSNCGRDFDLEAHHAHHEDYSKPNVIVWLCKKCHQRRHAELGTFKWKPDRSRSVRHLRHKTKQEMQAQRAATDLRKALRLLNHLTIPSQKAIHDKAARLGTSVADVVKQTLETATA